MPEITRCVFNPADGFRYTLTLPEAHWGIYKERKFKSLCKQLRNGEIRLLTDFDYPWLDIRVEKISGSIDDIVRKDEILSNN